MLKKMMLHLLLGSLLSTLVAANDVVILNDENFEHLTQASTGATTGDWFVEFYAPWCSHCKRLEPVWEEVAKELKGQVNFAKVDVTTSSTLGSRFSIRAFPSLKFFHQGKLYNYRGARDADSLIEFAKENYKNTPSIPVPPPPTFMDVIKAQFTEAAQAVKALYYQLAREVYAVINEKKSPDPQLMVILVGVVLIVLLAAFMCISVLTSGGGGRPAAGTPAGGAKKRN